MESSSLKCLFLPLESMELLWFGELLFVCWLKLFSSWAEHLFSFCNCLSKNWQVCMKYQVGCWKLVEEESGCWLGIVQLMSNGLVGLGNFTLHPQLGGPVAVSVWERWITSASLDVRAVAFLMSQIKIRGARVGVILGKLVLFFSPKWHLLSIPMITCGTLNHLIN